MKQHKYPENVWTRFYLSHADINYLKKINKFRVSANPDAKDTDTYSACWEYGFHGENGWSDPVKCRTINCKYMGQFIKLDGKLLKEATLCKNILRLKLLK